MEAFPLPRIKLPAGGPANPIGQTRRSNIMGVANIIEEAKQTKQKFSILSKIIKHASAKSILFSKFQIQKKIRRNSKLLMVYEQSMFARFYANLHSLESRRKNGEETLTSFNTPNIVCLLCVIL